jgi:plasmid stabilization system protein ParE
LPSLKWSLRALSDLTPLHAFLSPKNPDAARRAIRAIRQGAKSLAGHPGIGRLVEGMEPSFRDWFIPFGDSGYIIRYHHDDQAVPILAVRHAKEAGF